MGEILHQLVVDKVEHRRALLDQRHRDVKRAEDGGVFHADHAGADHREAARQAWDIDDLVPGEYRRAVERPAIRAMRTSANCDEDALALKDANVAGVGGDLDAVWIDEARGPEGGLHRVAGGTMLRKHAPAVE